jgi:NAD-dependent dihydropyrimidine dehydrogenase PreA subunit
MSAAAGTLTRPILRVAIYEGKGARALEAGSRLALMRSLLEKGYRVTRVTGASPAARPGDATLAVLGRFSDAPPEEAIDQSASIRVFFRNIEGRETDEAVALVDDIRARAGLPEPGGWKPWFPVIDYDRCTNCMQCLSFCLFDVYGVSGDGKIQVRNQDNCKTDCPACSRVCPEVAILFPKYRHGPIHGGEIHADDVRREALKIDISALLGGDIYQALRDRSAKAKSRFSKERDEDRALKERMRCLNKLQQDLDIPAEVLSALPTLEEIQAKAAAAQARAEAAAAAPPGE